MFVCVFVGVSELSCLNRWTYDLLFWHEGTAESPMKHKSGTLLKTSECNLKMVVYKTVVVSKGRAFAVDHPFNYLS